MASAIPFLCDDKALQVTFMIFARINSAEVNLCEKDIEKFFF